jgi:RND family efflux transporter MFP subunit
MTATKSWGAAAAAAALLLGACGGPQAPQAPPPPPVTVAAPLQERVVDWDDFVGRFEAPQRVEVRARTGGYLAGVHFRDGQTVRRGQLLFTLDPRPAQALLAAARAQLAQAEASRGLARTELARSQALLAATAISREEFEARTAAVAQADAAVQAAQAAVRARSLDVEFTRVTAPISGAISERRVDVGNLIAGGSSAGDVLTTIVSTSPIHFSFEASEAVMLKYRRGGAGSGRVQVRLQDEPDYRWSGTLDFTDALIDDASGAVRMRAVIANPSGLLRPGMFGHARLQGSGAYDAFLIPDTAVIADGPRRVVYVVDATNTVTPKPVEVGPLSGGLRVIRSGLAAGDKVVIDGIQRAMPGSKISPVQGRVTRQAPAAAAAPAAPTITAPPASIATPANGV